MVFNHSIKVPFSYKKVAKIIKKIKEDWVGLKNAVYGDNLNYNRNAQYNMPLVCKILEHFACIEHVLSTTEILTKEPRLDPWLARVLIYKLLWCKDLDHPSKPIQTIMKYKTELKDAFATYQEPESLKSRKKVVTPRYVRVNTFKMSVADVIIQFREEEKILLSSEYETYSEYLEAINQLEGNNFMIDFHIKEMLVFPPTTNLIKHPLYINGVLILQDKASCLAPLLLDPPKGGVVLDMCAAPGMKTTYLANQVGKKGRIYAVEKKEERYQILTKIIAKQGMKNIYCKHQDAIEITEDEFPDVEYIMVDPSCSGSGMVGRIDIVESSPDRLKDLATFQKIILFSALNNFPNVKRVVYSTCSLNPEENEEVIRDVLEDLEDFKLVNLQEKMGSNWNNFGSEKYAEVGPSCLYSRPEEDLTKGFFVAMFEKIDKAGKKKRKYEEIEEAEINEEENTPEEKIQNKNKKNKKDIANATVEDGEHLNGSNKKVMKKQNIKKNN